MSSCRPHSPPKRESGHCWHLARLPNQSPLREGEGCEREVEREGEDKKESVEQREERKERATGGKGKGGEKDLR